MFKPSNIIPNMKVENICEIDFISLKKLGIKFVVFDKDNTITTHLS